MRISELTELAESPASSDEFVIVDKSDTTQSTSGTTKRIQSQYVTIADASTTVKGKVELATDAEAITGTDTARAITPSNIVAAAPTFIPSTVHAATEKTTPVDADEFGLVDSAASYVLKKLTWANIKATLLTWLRLSTTIIPTNAPQGFLINGKISVTDTGSGLTVAIKTLSGTDPSATDPVYCRIGDTVRTISAALSVTLADGTNWMNLGSAELATKEADLPVFLGYNATDGVVIGFSRVWGEQYSDWSTTSTNEKYLAVSNRSNASATDYYECIGRFAATLSAGAGYTWSVPTYTAKNLIQRPIYESRDTSSTGTTTGFSSGPTVNVSNYRIKNGTCKYHYEGSLGGTSNATSYTIALPFSGKSGEINYFLIPEVKDNGSFQTTPGLGLIASGGTVITLYKNCAEAGWTASGQKGIASLDIEYKI